jgi:hypothetical protein
LQTTIADEAEETETESEKKEEKQDKEQMHDAIRGRSDTTLAKLTEVRLDTRRLFVALCVELYRSGMRHGSLSRLILVLRAVAEERGQGAVGVDGFTRAPYTG